MDWSSVGLVGPELSVDVVVRSVDQVAARGVAGHAHLDARSLSATNAECISGADGRQTPRPSRAGRARGAARGAIDPAWPPGSGHPTLASEVTIVARCLAPRGASAPLRPCVSLALVLLLAGVGEASLGPAAADRMPGRTSSWSWSMTGFRRSTTAPRPPNILLAVSSTTACCFDDAYSETPLCCPGSSVVSDRPAHSPQRRRAQRRAPARSGATTIAGRTFGTPGDFTMMVGKYLNGYSGVPEAGRLGPRVDRPVAGRGRGSGGWTARRCDASPSLRRRRPSRRQAVGLVSDARRSPPDQPLFQLGLDCAAPHACDHLAPPDPATSRP